MIRNLTLALAATTALASAANPEMKEAAKKLSAAHAEAVVWLSVLSKTSMSVDGDAPAQVKQALAGQDREEKSEVIGTVVDASGLIVTALGGMDKSSMVDGQTVNTPMGEIKLKATSEIKEVKIITADGSEVPGDLVLKDEDLGLAFIKVRTESEEAKGVEFKAIDLADSAKGDLLDDCIALGRMDEAMNRETSLWTSEIVGITSKPRAFYRVPTDSVGCPVFLSNGKLLGISVLRQGKGGSRGQIQPSQVVLPAADVAKTAAQAKDAKPVAAKKEAEAPAKEDEK
ncbi:trypsin-like peptidase domain-containing protein [Haloferula sp. BvORR071]|uniref:trypsin-like peptidase domain-containing protein n=1 Tax=Haloferula sp. BvORR071 TaxID=1396141 RepID=UPI00055305D6|nr:trypsin-like peptidase domain-containing protein [Haloferula sp. BvORR071]